MIVDCIIWKGNKILLQIEKVLAAVHFKFMFKAINNAAGCANETMRENWNFHFRVRQQKKYLLIVNYFSRYSIVMRLPVIKVQQICSKFNKVQTIVTSDFDINHIYIDIAIPPSDKERGFRSKSYSLAAVENGLKVWRNSIIDVQHSSNIWQSIISILVAAQHKTGVIL